MGDIGKVKELLAFLDKHGVKYTVEGNEVVVGGSDIYDAVYSVALSRIGRFDGDALRHEIASKFDFSWQMGQVAEEFKHAAWAVASPSAVYRPTLTRDGNAWIALYGEDIATGAVGTGATPSDAMTDFDKRWFEAIQPLPERETCPICMGKGLSLIHI